MDELTATQIPAPNITCPALPASCANGLGGFSANGAASEGSGSGGGSVTVTKQQNVGPYDTVQLHASDSSALNNWLAQNSFTIPSAVTPVIDAYVSEGFDFLAMKLLPDQGVSAMRPVRVTTPGASVSLPLRMASIGTGATVGITIWVVSDGRYEPENFPFFHIDDSQLVWNFTTSASNYTTLRAQDETALGGKGWEIESSIDLNQQTIASVIESGGVYYPGGGYSPAPESDAGEDYLPIVGGGGSADGGDDGGVVVVETADQVRDDDVAALFAGNGGTNVRVTRIRSDISHAAMTTDLILQASADQSELSNIRNVTQSVGLVCPIYENCAIVGYGTPAQAQASLSGGGGCVTSAQSSREPASLAALGGLFALVALRIGRARRGSSKKA
jgi:hypothetical protein